MKKKTHNQVLVSIDSTVLSDCRVDIQYAKDRIAEAMRELSKIIGEIDIPIMSPYIRVSDELELAKYELDNVYDAIDI